MKHWRHKILRPWFIVLLMIAFTHQFVEKQLRIHISIIDSYLDPLLLMPILLHLLLWERRLLFRKGDVFTFSKLRLVLLFTTISFITEYMFPKWNPRFTADIWDILCYALGTLFFHIYLNVPYKKKYMQNMGS